MVVKSARRLGSATVGLIVGGTFQEVARNPELLKCDALIYLDVAGEITKVRAKPGVLKWALAEGETVATLMNKAGCSPETRKALEGLPAANLADGLGQLRAVGAMAVRVLLCDPRFAQFLREKVLHKLMMLHGGVINDVTLLVFASNAGGVGGPVAIPVAERLRDLFLDRFECTVHTLLIRAGSISYEGMGERVHLNGAATVIEDLDWLQSSNHHPSEVRSYLAFELPMVEDDYRLRNHYVGHAVQVLFSQDMTERFATCAPNSHLSGRFGGVTLGRCFYYTGLKASRTAAEVSRRFRQELQALDSLSDSSDAAQIDLDFEEGSFHVSRLIENQVSGTALAIVVPDDLITACKQISYSGHLIGNVRLPDGTSFAIGAARAFPSRPQDSTAAYRLHLGQASAVNRGLEQALLYRREQLTAKGQEHALRETDFRRASARQYPHTVWQQLSKFVKNLFTEPVAAQAAYRSALERVYESARAVACLKAEADALEEVQSEFAGELLAVRRRVKDTATVLAQFDTAVTNRHQTLVHPAPLDTLVNDLLKAASGDIAEVGQILASRIEAVTLHGLAQITGAAAARASAIAEMLVHQHDDITAAPPWGADNGFASRHVFVALPKVSDETFDEIRIQLRRLDDTVTLVRCDTAVAGANVLRIAVFHPNVLEDIISRFVGRYLEEARRQPELYFPNGTQCIEKVAWDEAVLV